MTGFDTKKHSNVKRKAEYRRINKYFKGLEKWKQEKLRRKQILDLQDRGLTIRQIAKQLHVSERTVKRDLAKIRPYIRRSRKHFAPYESRNALKQLDELSTKQQLKRIRDFKNRWGKSGRIISAKA